MTTPAQKPGARTGGRPLSTLVCANCGRHNRIGASERGSPHCGNCGKPLAWVVDANEDGVPDFVFQRPDLNNPAWNNLFVLLSDF